MHRHGRWSYQSVTIRKCSFGQVQQHEQPPAPLPAHRHPSAFPDDILCHAHIFNTCVLIIDTNITLALIRNSSRKMLHTHICSRIACAWVHCLLSHFILINGYLAFGSICFPRNHFANFFHKRT